MAVKHLQEVATGAGMTADQVKALIDLPEDAADFKADTYVTPLREAVATAVRNDPKFYETINAENLPKEVVKKFETEQYGRAASQVRGYMLKAVGLTEKEFADLGEEGKKLDVFTPAFAKKLAEGKVSDKQLQQTLIEANKKIEELEAGTPAIEKKYADQYEAKFAETQFNMHVLTNLAAVPGLKVQPGYVAGVIGAKLKAQYAVVLGEDGTPVLRQKANPTLDVLVDGKTPLTLAAAITAIANADNLVETKKKVDEKTGKTEVDKDGKGGLKISGHVNDKMARRLAEEAKANGGA